MPSVVDPDMASLVTLVMTECPMEPQCTALTSADLLGGARVFTRNPQAPLAWVSLVREGFPVACVAELAEHLKLPLAQLAPAIGMSPPTLAKRMRDGLLKCEESVRLLRLARVIEQAIAVFEEVESAVDWLHHRNHALGGVTPISLLDTEFGAEEVSKVLGHIAHGILY